MAVMQSWTRESKAGGLRHRIMMQRGTPVTGAGGGQSADVWVTYATLWGEVRDLTATQTIAARQAMSVVTSIIRLRFRMGILPNDRAVWVSTPAPALSALASSINAGVTAVALGNVATYPTVFPYLLALEGEVVQVTAAYGEILTVTRGFAGTTAAAHAAGVPAAQAAIRIFGVAGARDETGRRVWTCLDVQELSSGT